MMITRILPIPNSSPLKIDFLKFFNIISKSHPYYTNSYLLKL
jgi:hypothetical protein